MRAGRLAARRCPTADLEPPVELAWSFGRGFVIGFAIAAAIGPIGLLCIRRTLAEGRAIGAVSGLGAATADAFYASIAAFGLTALSDLLVGARRPLGILGGCFLVVLAIHSLLRPAVAASDRPPRTMPSAYATTVGLTIANPAHDPLVRGSVRGPGSGRPFGRHRRRSRRGGLLWIGSLVDHPGGLRVGLPKPPRAGRAASSGGRFVGSYRPARRPCRRRQSRGLTAPSGRSRPGGATGAPSVGGRVS